MNRDRLQRSFAPTVRAALACVAINLLFSLTSARAQQAQSQADAGALEIIGDDGKPAGGCPLKHTTVTCDITGFLARTTVKQTFTNPLDRKIEAIYVFPLPQDSAVDSMVMLVGDRKVIGQIKEREEARQIYEEAKAAGHVAGLLDQERPNIFTQSVANIEPGVTVEIEISYVETLKYEDGVFEWVFPMVVGPRYIPDGSAPAPMASGQDTPEVPDASRITPPVTPPGTRAGHDIDITVHLNPGMPIGSVESVLHAIDMQADGSDDAGPRTITLAGKDEIPNKDFILRYRPTNESIGDAFLTHTDDRGSFFTLILQPPQRVVPEQLMPRELIFVLDTSGSMGGFPIEKAKEVMARLIDTMRPGDTFNLITFAGNTRVLWTQPRPNTDANRDEAQEFLAGQHGGGGTEMMKAIDAALVQTRSDAPTNGPQPIRIVCFMTDGYVGNDMAIIDAVKRNADTTRVFSFGVGNSVNRYLLDGMARAGRGEAEYVTLASQGDAAVERFHERVLAPVLTDIDVDWGDLSVADVFPTRVPDLFSSKPILVHGRLTGPASGTITIRGNTGAGPYEEAVNVSGSQTPADSDALVSLWARANVEDLMNRDLDAMQKGTFPDDLKARITALGVEFHLMTQFTSFVAVEELTVTAGGEPTTVQVPVEMPEGVSYEGVFGNRKIAGTVIRQSRGGVGGGMRMPASPPPPATQLKALGYAGGVSEDEDAMRERPAAKPLDPSQKLAEILRGLAEKTAQEGKDGNLIVGELKVVDWRVDVRITLSDVSDETRNALADLGFQLTGESKTVKLLIGSLDVRKLADLAKLDAVLSVKPLKG